MQWANPTPCSTGRQVLQDIVFLCSWRLKELEDQVAAQRDEISAAAALLRAAQEEAAALRGAASAGLAPHSPAEEKPPDEADRNVQRPAFCSRFGGFSLPPAFGNAAFGGSGFSGSGSGGGDSETGVSRQPSWQHQALARQLADLDAELKNVQAVKTTAKANAEAAKADAEAEAAKAEALADENLEVSQRIVELDADLRAAQV